MYPGQVRTRDLAERVVALQSSVTGYPELVLRTVVEFLLSGGTSEGAVRSRRIFPPRFIESARRSPPAPTTGFKDLAPSDTSAAARLRDLSGLDAERLGELFGVSRVTFQNWTAGTIPHDARRERLLEVLSLVEEAAKRLGTPRATADWLLTPTTAGGKKPIQLLKARQDRAFRGHLLRAGRSRLLLQAPRPSRSRRVLTDEERASALARLQARAPYREDIERVLSSDELATLPERPRE